MSYKNYIKLINIYVKSITNRQTDTGEVNPETNITSYIVYVQHIQNMIRATTAMKIKAMKIKQKRK